MFAICSFLRQAAYFGRNPLSTTVPHRPDRRLRPARTEAAAVPAPAIKAWPGIPIKNRTAISRPLPFDSFGRTITGQKAIPVPVTSHMPLSVRGRSKCCHRQQQGHPNNDDARESPQHYNSLLKDNTRLRLRPRFSQYARDPALTSASRLSPSTPKIRPLFHPGCLIRGRVSCSHILGGDNCEGACITDAHYGGVGCHSWRSARTSHLLRYPLWLAHRSATSAAMMSAATGAE